MPRPFPFEVGTRFGKWTVTEVRVPGKNNTKVVCDCGTERFTVANHLVSGKSTQCRSCAGRSNPGNEGRRKSGVHLSAMHKYHEYRRGAKNAGRDFELSFDYFMVITQQDCHYCDEAPSNVNKVDKEWAEDFVYNGIDRLDSTKGYTEDNVLPCCKYCNYMKRELTYSEFTARISRIAAKHPAGSVLIKATPMRVKVL